MSAFRLRHRLAALVPLTLAVASVHPFAQGQVHEGQYAQADIIKGQSTYRGQCASCHGTNGDAVGGVDLRRGRFRNARSDEDMSRLISTGIPGTAMPPFKFDAAEL